MTPKMSDEELALKASVQVRGAAIFEVLKERDRQDEKWGEQNHDPFTYLAILSEEVGELAQAALHCRFWEPSAGGTEFEKIAREQLMTHVLTEAIHTAAVAQAIVECLLRGKWRWPE